MIRVLNVGPTAEQPGGMASVVAELADQNRLSAAPVNLRVVDSGGIGSPPRRGARFARALLGAVTARVDVAHLHVASRGSTWRKAAIARACSLRGLPYGIHLHGAGYAGFLSSSSPAGKRLVEHFFHGAAYVVVLGEPWARLVADELSVPRSRIHIVHNGVSGGAPPDVPWPADRRKRVVFLGEIGARKGVPELLRAFEQLDAVPDAELVLAGPPSPSDPDVVRQVEEAVRTRPDRIRYAGALARARSRDLLREAYLLALPSHAEGLPMVVVEAMSLGVPCVTTPVGAMEEAVTDGVNGVLVQPGNPDALAGQLRRLLDDVALRDAMARSAHDTWAQGFDARSMYEDLRALWAQAAG
ncbi:glycosyltransferase family 4 protein [Blastococcus saxobsidens]|uniref:Glycosyltransferase involved in cell wall biosynthesis n=1 Tax=Blastococcus saxobsidens TaxID=138336 RepID=A0A4Q7YAA0_9ACTN|nr:glycosyltransferase family 4 protein [Blastococcus saxobsidens]RZU34107.1 glycosyltransferase involved in cell wall biosynthesis [Blastococcus saxobsidens]